MQRLLRMLQTSFVRVQHQHIFVVCTQYILQARNAVVYGLEFIRDDLRVLYQTI
jgi:hypothetical protein